MRFKSHIVNSIKEDLSIKSEFNIYMDLLEMAKLWRELQDSLYVTYYTFEFRPQILSDACVINEGKVDFKESSKAYHAEHTAQLHVKVSSKGSLKFYGQDGKLVTLATVVKAWSSKFPIAKAILRRVEDDSVVKSSVKDIFEFMSWIQRCLDMDKERQSAVNKIASIMFPLYRGDSSESISFKTKTSIQLANILVGKYESFTDIAYMDLPYAKELVDEIKLIQRMSVRQIEIAYPEIVQPVKSTPTQPQYTSHGFIHERDLNTSTKSSQINVNLDCIFDDDEEF